MSPIQLFLLGDQIIYNIKVITIICLNTLSHHLSDKIYQIKFTQTQGMF